MPWYAIYVHSTWHNSRKWRRLVHNTTIYYWLDCIKGEEESNRGCGLQAWQDIGKEIYSVHAFGWWWVRRTCRRRGTVFCGIITDFWNLSVWARNGHTVKVAQAWARKPRSTKDGQGKEIYSVHDFGWWWVRRSCRRRGTVFCGIVTDFWNLFDWPRNGHTVKAAQAWARKPGQRKMDKAAEETKGTSRLFEYTTSGRIGVENAQRCSKSTRINN